MPCCLVSLYSNLARYFLRQLDSMSTNSLRNGIERNSERSYHDRLNTFQGFNSAHRTLRGVRMKARMMSAAFAVCPIIQILMVGTFLASGISAFGYSVHWEALYKWPGSVEMSLPTAICIMIISVSVFALAQMYQPLTKIRNDDRNGLA